MDGSVRTNRMYDTLPGRHNLFLQHVRFLTPKTAHVQTMAWYCLESDRRGPANAHSKLQAASRAFPAAAGWVPRLTKRFGGSEAHPPCRRAVPSSPRRLGRRANGPAAWQLVSVVSRRRTYAICSAKFRSSRPRLSIHRRGGVAVTSISRRKEPARLPG